VESISATIAHIVRLSVSRSAFAQQASTVDTSLSQPSYMLLRVLIDEGPMPIGQLARKAHMDVGMATRRVRALDDAGLIARHTDSTDRRVTIIGTTPEGQRAARALQELRREHLQRALSHWSATELREFDRLLKKFLSDTTQTPLDEA
jgi:DNA-binding MarR family transcriptional regulator